MHTASHTLSRFTSERLAMPTMFDGSRSHARCRMARCWLAGIRSLVLEPGQFSFGNAQPKGTNWYSGRVAKLLRSLCCTLATTTGQSGGDGQYAAIGTLSSPARTVNFGLFPSVGIVSVLCEYVTKRIGTPQGRRSLGGMRHSDWHCGAVI